jgi:hypothetical protein
VSSWLTTSYFLMLTIFFKILPCMHEWWCMFMYLVI